LSNWPQGAAVVGESSSHVLRVADHGRKQESMPKTGTDADQEYLRRTANRLRTMAAASADMSDQDPAEVEARLKRMSYGRSRPRRQTNTLP